ncbi:MAG: type VI secretion system baseplate subunit TssE [Chlorobi bacterium]|nr:type VI secretion system baseplate subunit TssE [Chlorobiota bacterium]
MQSPFLRTKALLFDRLSPALDSDPATESGYIGLELVKRSIIEQLEHLLNSRRMPGYKTSLTVLDYGIPDHTAQSVGDLTQMRQLVRSIEQAVVTFEPRLKNVRAELINTNPSSLEQTLQIRLSAQLHVEPLTDDMNLYLVLSGKYGTVRIYEREPS